jgi:predicted AAA+ superfamily ATPase
MQPVDDLFPRHAKHAVSAALSDTRVVVINGARQTGKSTLAKLVIEGCNSRIAVPWV